MASLRSELILEVTHFSCALHHRRRPGHQTDRGLSLAGKTRARTSDSAGWPRHAIETRVDRGGVLIIRCDGRRDVFHLRPSPPVFFCEKCPCGLGRVTTITVENENAALAFADAGCPREQRSNVMQHALPSNPNLDHMKREARYLLHGLLTRESSALRRFNP
jgi:hypothetical protein